MRAINPNNPAMIRQNIITKLHQTHPVSPNVVAKYVPKIIVQTNGNNASTRMNNIIPTIPTPINNSSIICIFL